MASYCKPTLLEFNALPKNVLNQSECMHDQFWLEQSDSKILETQITQEKWFIKLFFCKWILIEMSYKSE